MASCGGTCGRLRQAGLSPTRCICESEDPMDDNSDIEKELHSILCFRGFLIGWYEPWR